MPSSSPSGLSGHRPHVPPLRRRAAGVRERGRAPRGVAPLRCLFPTNCVGAGGSLTIRETPTKELGSLGEAPPRTALPRSSPSTGGPSWAPASSWRPRASTAWACPRWTSEPSWTHLYLNTASERAALHYVISMSCASLGHLFQVQVHPNSLLQVRIHPEKPPRTACFCPGRAPAQAGAPVRRHAPAGGVPELSAARERESVICRSGVLVQTAKRRAGHIVERAQCQSGKT